MLAAVVAEGVIPLLVKLLCGGSKKGRMIANERV
jgi:hypothetical protein